MTALTVASLRIVRHCRKGVLLAITITGVAVLGLSACARPATIAGSPAASVSSPVTTPPPPVTVVVPPPATVYVPQPETVTVPADPKPTQTNCQWLYANSYSYDQTFAMWAQDGFPVNWDADRDGFPCEQTYGDQN